MMGRLGLRLRLRRLICTVVAVLLALQLLLIVLKVPHQTREEQTRGLVQVPRYTFWSTGRLPRLLNFSTGASTNVSREDGGQVVVVAGRRQSENQSYVASVTARPQSTFEENYHGSIVTSPLHKDTNITQTVGTSVIFDKSSLVVVPQQQQQAGIPHSNLIPQAQRKSVERKTDVPPMRSRRMRQPLSQNTGKYFICI